MSGTSVSSEALHQRQSPWNVACFSLPFHLTRDSLSCTFSALQATCWKLWIWVRCVTPSFPNLATQHLHAPAWVSSASALMCLEHCVSWYFCQVLETIESQYKPWPACVEKMRYDDMLFEFIWYKHDTHQWDIIQTLDVWFDFGNDFGTEARACRLRTATEVVEATKKPRRIWLEWSQEAPFECSVQGSSCFPKLKAHFCLALTVLKDAFPAMASRQETRWSGIGNTCVLDSDLTVEVDARTIQKRNAGIQYTCLYHVYIILHRVQLWCTLAGSSGCNPSNDFGWAGIAAKGRLNMPGFICFAALFMTERFL